MASHSSDHDPEAVFPDDTKASKFSQGARPFFEAAALLSVWSVLVIGEGVVRFINSDPSQNLFANVPLPPIVPFLGGLFEVAFGIAGLIVGLSALIFNDHDPRATKMVMIFQSVTGFYVLAVFVFAMPALRASGLTKGILAGLSLNASRAIITFGILTSLSWCFALQGGQFLFMARLIAGATGTNFMGHGKGSRMRALFWNTNFALSGLWTLVTGILLTSQFGARPLSKPFVAPPNVGLWPVMTLFTGALMLGWGVLGNFLSISGKRGPMRSYVKVTAAVYLWVLCNYSIVQLGAIPGEPRPAAGGALHAGLVFMVMFLGPYFMVKQVEEQEVQA